MQYIEMLLYWRLAMHIRQALSEKNSAHGSTPTLVASSKNEANNTVIFFSTVSKTSIRWADAFVSNENYLQSELPNIRSTLRLQGFPAKDSYFSSHQTQSNAT